MDIIAIGNSNLASAFSPMDLWKEQGYTSYNCGEPFQRVCEANKMLEEVLTCQAPKVVILEVDGTYLGGIKTGLDETIGTEIKGYFPVMEYHNRWKCLTKIDFNKPQYTWKSEEKGFILRKKTKGYMGKEYMIESSRKSILKPSVWFFLNKFVALCNKNNIPILFIESPTATSWNYSRHNAIAAYAQEKDIPFLDLNINRQELNINWETDTPDGGYHLNYTGSLKVTAYLGKYLNEHYNLTDHRNDTAYSQWNADLENFKINTELYND